MAELTIDEAKAVYEVLVEHCGYTDRPHERAQFISNVTRGGFMEYRFIGAMGFGGKFWSSHHRWYVTLYREHETDDRIRRRDRANALLAALYRHHRGEEPRWGTTGSN